MKILVVPNFLCECCWQPLTFDRATPSPETTHLIAACSPHLSSPDIREKCERSGLRLVVPLERLECRALTQ